MRHLVAAKCREEKLIALQALFEGQVLLWPLVSQSHRPGHRGSHSFRLLQYGNRQLTCTKS